MLRILTEVLGSIICIFGYIVVVWIWCSVVVFVVWDVWSIDVFGQANKQFCISVAYWAP